MVEGNFRDDPTIDQQKNKRTRTRSQTAFDRLDQSEMKNYLAVLTSFVNMSSMLEFNTIVALFGDLETIKHVCVCVDWLALRYADF